jgi:hypothetical protein
MKIKLRSGEAQEGLLEKIFVTGLYLKELKSLASSVAELPSVALTNCIATRRLIILDDAATARLYRSPG